MELLERERELAAVEGLLQRRGGVLVADGGVGLGKTALVEAACGRAEELGQEVLRSRGSELEAEFAFGVVRQLFGDRRAGGARRASGWAGRCGWTGACGWPRRRTLRQVVRGPAWLVLAGVQSRRVATPAPGG
jgi:hypothetical protein